MQQTVFCLEPITQKAKDWIEEQVKTEPWQWLGNALVVEHRYIADIAAGLIEAGLIPNRDFRVS